MLTQGGVRCMLGLGFLAATISGCVATAPPRSAAPAAMIGDSAGNEIRFVADFKRLNELARASDATDDDSEASELDVVVTGRINGASLRTTSGKIILRGHSKRTGCTNAPFAVRLDDGPLPPALAGKTKVARHCGTFTGEGEEPVSTDNWVRRERLVYEVYRLLLGDGASLQVTPFHASFAQTNKSPAMALDAYAFLLEAAKSFAKRTETTDMKVKDRPKAIKTDDLDQQAVLNGLIATFVTGGNDVSLGVRDYWQNVLVFRRSSDGVSFPVFYDFDGSAPVRGNWRDACMHGWPFEANAIAETAIDAAVNTLAKQWASAKPSFRKLENIALDGAPSGILISDYVDTRFAWLTAVLKNPERRRRFFDASISVVKDPKKNPCRADDQL